MGKSYVKFLELAQLCRSKAIYGKPLGELSNDDCILWIVGLYKNNEVNIPGTEYRIEEVEVLE